MKRRARSHVKEKIRMVAILAILVAIVAVIVIAWKMINPKTSTKNIAHISKGTTTKEVLQENNWDSDIISNVTVENVPIPKGYSYVSGDVTTGTIIKDTIGRKYLWIPYEENPEVDVSEYYKNVENYYEFDSYSHKSMEKYNGFYVSLNTTTTIEDLKDISNEDYDKYATSLNSTQSNGIARTHLLNKEEIAQVVSYMNDKNFYIANNDVGIEANFINRFTKVSNTVSTQKQSGKIQEIVKLAATDNTTAQSKEGTYRNYHVQSTSKYGENALVPIPEGYDVEESNDGVVTISNSTNKYLNYIWVPLETSDIDGLKDYIKSQYLNINLKEEKINVDFYRDDIDNASDAEEYVNNHFAYGDISKHELYSNILDSIGTYKGFYISEAELSKLQGSENRSNMARGMSNWSSEEADYYRGDSDNDIVKMGSEGVKSVYEGAYSIALKDSTDSVISHLSFGFEYDAAIKWILETNANQLYDWPVIENEKIVDWNKNSKTINEVLLCDSTFVGKYKYSQLSGNSTVQQSSKFFNGIWGLGGNLAEITQEQNIKDGTVYSILRGGSYKTSGEAKPIASGELKSEYECFEKDIGMRTCLYLKDNLKQGEDIYPNTEGSEQVDDETWDKSINGVRYVFDWNGANIYEEPDLNSKVLTTYSFATEVNVLAKKKEPETDFKDEGQDDGSEKLWWAKIEYPDGNSGVAYVNAQRLTDRKDTIEKVETGTDNPKSIDFLLKEDGPITRYYNIVKHEVYTAPNKDKGKKLVNIIDTDNEKMREKVEVIGKSIINNDNGENIWAKIKINGEEFYVPAKYLHSNEEPRIVNNVEFNVVDSMSGQISCEFGGLAMFLPGESNNKCILVENNAMVTITAISTDEKWYEIKYGIEDEDEQITYYYFYIESRFVRTSDFQETGSNQGQYPVETVATTEEGDEAQTQEAIKNKQEIGYDQFICYEEQAVATHGRDECEIVIENEEIKKVEYNAVIMSNYTYELDGYKIYSFSDGATPAEGNLIVNIWIKNDNTEEVEQPEPTSEEIPNDLTFAISSDITERTLYDKVVSLEWEETSAQIAKNQDFSVTVDNNTYDDNISLCYWIIDTVSKGENDKASTLVFDKNIITINEDKSSGIIYLTSNNNRKKLLDIYFYVVNKIADSETSKFDIIGSKVDSNEYTIYYKDSTNGGLKYRKQKVDFSNSKFKINKIEEIM